MCYNSNGFTLDSVVRVMVGREMAAEEKERGREAGAREREGLDMEAKDMEEGVMVEMGRGVEVTGLGALG